MLQNASQFELEWFFPPTMLSFESFLLARGKKLYKGWKGNICDICEKMCAAEISFFFPILLIISQLLRFIFGQGCNQDFKMLMLGVQVFLITTSLQRYIGLNLKKK